MTKAQAGAGPASQLSRAEAARGTADGGLCPHVTESRRGRLGHGGTEQRDTGSHVALAWMAGMGQQPLALAPECPSCPLPLCRGLGYFDATASWELREASSSTYPTQGTGPPGTLVTCRWGSVGGVVTLSQKGEPWVATGR